MDIFNLEIRKTDCLYSFPLLTVDDGYDDADLTADDVDDDDDDDDEYDRLRRRKWSQLDDDWDLVD